MQRTADIEDLGITYAYHKTNQRENHRAFGEIIDVPRTFQESCNWTTCLDFNQSEALEVLQKKRNCLASAKYRRKKQVESQRLQAKVEELSIERERLLRRIEQLEDENRSLHKQLLTVNVSKG